MLNCNWTVRIPDDHEPEWEDCSVWEANIPIALGLSEANAHLIAAAPELLEALKRTLAYAEALERECERLGNKVANPRNATLEPARAAIARA